MSRPSRSGATLCPRCNHWRTPDQMSGSVCGDCLCTIPGCKRVIGNREHRWCDTHYRRWLRRPDRDVTREPANRNLCSGAMCLRYAVVRGMCEAHYRQWRRSGVTVPIRPRYGGPKKPLGRESIGETERLLGTDTPESIARRLGYDSVANLARVLYRWGRADLARKLSREAA